jgi:hypothetical protein
LSDDENNEVLIAEWDHEHEWVGGTVEGYELRLCIWCGGQEGRMNETPR